LSSILTGASGGEPARFKLRDESLEAVWQRLGIRLAIDEGQLVRNPVENLALLEGAGGRAKVPLRLMNKDHETPVRLEFSSAMYYFEHSASGSVSAMPLRVSEFASDHDC
jgi:hypothetical protein